MAFGACAVGSVQLAYPSSCEVCPPLPDGHYTRESESMSDVTPEIDDLPISDADEVTDPSQNPDDHTPQDEESADVDA